MDLGGLTGQHHSRVSLDELAMSVDADGREHRSLVLEEGLCPNP
jgi:hypothetical protein